MVGVYSYVEVFLFSVDGVDDLIIEIVEVVKVNWEIKCV